nr:MAG TPA: activity-regulated cytoskeleton associated protein [Caudoviricetes sp.]
MREFFGIPEDEAEQPIFHGTHGEAYLDGGDVERWLELVEVEVE